MARTPPSQAEVDGYFETLNNWDRWGDDDQRGTVNMITPEKQAAAQARVPAYSGGMCTHGMRAH